jgi:hypothetical protein
MRSCPWNFSRVVFSESVNGIPRCRTDIFPSGFGTTEHIIAAHIFTTEGEGFEPSMVRSLRTQDLTKPNVQRSYQISDFGLADGIGGFGVSSGPGGPAHVLVDESENFGKVFGAFLNNEVGSRY